MPVLRLILDPEGAAFDVDDAILIGGCAAQLASQLGYPTVDSSGMPVIYQLRLTKKGSFLPNDQQFRDLQLATGTRFTLASSTASAPTRPVPAASLTAATQHKSRPRHRWSRRTLLTTGTLAAFALSGLGTGLAVAMATMAISWCGEPMGWSGSACSIPQPSPLLPGHLRVSDS
jgi:hypothetical protein